MFYSVCFLSFALFFPLLKDTGAADRLVIVTVSGEIKILVQTELGAESGKVEFKGIFTSRCVSDVLGIDQCGCVYRYRTTLACILKTFVRITRHE